MSANQRTLEIVASSPKHKEIRIAFQKSIKSIIYIHILSPQESSRISLTRSCSRICPVRTASPKHDSAEAQASTNELNLQGHPESSNMDETG